MPHLTAFYSIDGFSRQQIIGLKLLGGANIQGPNGAGKTTLMRCGLIPFGTQPGEIVRESEVNKAFGDYYLPRNTSYLVFEYQRSEDDVCCVICTYNNQGNVEYRFLNAPYRPELFLTPAGERSVIKTHEQFKQAITATEGLELSPALGALQFREVFQNNKPYRHDDRKRAQQINQLRRRFSFCPPGQSMDHVDRVISSVMRNKPSLGSVRDTLADVMVNQGVIPSKILRLNLQNDSVDSWLASYLAYNAVESNKELFLQLGELAEKNLALEKSITFKLKLVQQRHVNLLEEKQALEKLNEEEESLYGNKADSLRGRLGTVEAELSTLSGVIANLKPEINGLELTKQRYVEGDDDYPTMSELKGLAENKGIFEQEMVSARKHADILSVKVKDLEMHYKELIDKLTTSAAKLEKHAKEQEAGQFKALAQAIETLNEQANTAIQQIQTTAKVRRKQAQQERNSVREAVGRLKAETENRSLPEKFDLQIKELEADGLELTKDIRELNLEISNDSKAVKSKEQSRQKLEDERHQLSKRIVRIQEEQARLRNMLEDGSLLQFLQGSNPAELKDILKVLDPTLLARKHLNPTLGEPSATVYGLKLDLRDIESPAELSETGLYEAITTLEEELVNLEVQLKTLDQKINDANNELQQAKSQAYLNQQALFQFQTQQVELEMSIEAVNACAEEAINARCERLHAELKSKEQKDRELAQSLTDIDSQETQSIQDSKQMLAVDKKRLHDQYEAEIQGIQQRLEKEINRLRDQVKQYKEEQRLAEMDRGVDTVSLAQARKQVDEAQKRLMQAEQAIARIKTYEAFLANEWQKHESMVKDLLRKTAQIDEYKMLQRKLTKDLADLNNAEKERGRQRRSELEIFSNQISMATSLFNQLEVQGFKPAGVTIELQSHQTISLLKQQLSQDEAEWQSSAKQGRSNLNKIRETIIHRHPQSMVAVYFNRANKEASQSADFDMAKLWRPMGEAMRNYVEDSHPSELQLAISRGKNLGAQIADFGSDLMAAEREIRVISNRMTQSTADVVESFPAIEDMTVDISSRLSKLGYWDDLKAFKQFYEQWVNTPSLSNQLPTEEFQHRLESLRSMLNSDDMVVDISDQFNIQITVVDQGTVKTATTDKSLVDISSNGLSALVIVSLYVGLLEQIRTDTSCRVVFPIDEIATLSSQNMIALINKLKAHNIDVISAAPETKPEIMRQFQWGYELKKERGDRRALLSFDPKKALTRRQRLEQRAEHFDTARGLA